MKPRLLKSRRAAVVFLAVLALACSAPADPSWKELREPDAPFTLEAPGDAKREDINEKSPAGPVSGRQYRWKTPSQRFYIAMYLIFDNPNNIPLNMSQAMKNMVEGIARRSQGSISAEKPSKLHTLDGTQSEVKTGTSAGSITIRSAEQGNRIYILAAGAPQGREKPEDAERFFDSFKLK